MAIVQAMLLMVSVTSNAKGAIVNYLDTGYSARECSKVHNREDINAICEEARASAREAVLFTCAEYNSKNCEAGKFTYRVVASDGYYCNMSTFEKINSALLGNKRAYSCIVEVLLSVDEE